MRLLRAKARLRVAVCVSLPLLAPTHHAAAAHSVAEAFHQACSAEQQQLVRIEADLASYLDTGGIRHK